jgi:peptidoglycan/LPS O-acetylase OafA/YrhL
LQPFLHSVVPQIAFMLTGLSPLVPGQGLPPVGPWWFIPFILEFYAIYFVLRRLTKEFGWPGLVVLAFVGMAATTIAAPLAAHWKINLYETPLGRLPSLCLGIAAARYSLRMTWPLVMAAGAVLVLGNEYQALWPFTFAAAAILALWAYMELRDNLRESRSLERIGEYSILIFLLNGIVRDDFLRFATTPLLQLLFGAISAAASFAIAAIVQECLIRPFSPVVEAREGIAEVAETVG